MFFTGKLAVISGAARGIGRASAEALAAAGAHVIVIDIDAKQADATAQSIRAHGGQAQAMACDVANDSQVNEVAATLIESLGAPHFLINNAFARRFARGTLEDVDVEVCKRAFDINVLGNIRMHKAFLPGMLARGSGHIIDTASSLSIVPNEDAQMLLPYVASKGAILGMAYGLRHALYDSGIQYSLFCPGLTDTAPAEERSDGTPNNAAPPSFAATVLLEGIERGDFLISSEPDFAAKILRLAYCHLDPIAAFGYR